jgi:hypothetical protein
MRLHISSIDCRHIRIASLPCMFLIYNHTLTHLRTQINAHINQTTGQVDRKHSFEHWSKSDCYRGHAEGWFSQSQTSDSRGRIEDLAGHARPHFQQENWQCNSSQGRTSNDSRARQVLKQARTSGKLQNNRSYGNEFSNTRTTRGYCTCQKYCVEFDQRFF